jgi:phosphate-selective porin OprO/OprP
MKFPIALALASFATSAAVSAGPGGGSNDPLASDPQPGLTLGSFLEEFKPKITGRLYNDWGWFSTDDASAFVDDDGTEFRAARIAVEATMYDLIDLKTEYDFAGTPDFKDVYMAMRESPVGRIQVGHFKEPFSLEELTSSRFITFMERSVANAFVPSRNTGIQVSDKNEASTVTWAVGIFRDADNLGVDTGDGEYAVTGRVTWTPWNNNGGEGNDNSLLHLGVAASHRDADDGMARFRVRPEAHLLNQVADTGSFEADDVDLLGVEGSWGTGPFNLQSEYILAMVESQPNDDPNYSGFYVQGSCFLTGEYRTYKSASGAFDRVKVLNNYSKYEGRGAVEVTARYSMLDLNDGPTEDELADVTLGLNWYLNPYSRIMFNLIQSQFEEGAVDDDAQIAMVRFQVDW